MMNFLRRASLPTGIVLFAVGWGVMRYSDARQRAVADGKADSLSVWAGEPTKVSSWLQRGEFVSGRTLAAGGIIGMGTGAVLVAMGLAYSGRFGGG